MFAISFFLVFSMAQPLSQSELEQLLAEFRVTTEKGIHKLGATNAFRINKYRKAIPAILDSTKGEDDMTRAGLAGVVLMIDPADVRALAILSECLKSKDDDVRVAAVVDLCNTEVAVEKKWAIFERTMQDPCPMVRVHTLVGLEDIVRTSNAMQREALKLVVDALKDASESVRETAIESVGMLPSHAKTVVPALMPILNDPSPDMRERAARSLGKIGKDAAGAVPALGKLLSDKNDDVRYAVACALYLMGPAAKSAIKDLAQHLDRPESHRGVRFRVMSALENLGRDSQVALPALQRIASQDEDAEVARAAASAIKKIKG